MGIPSKLPFQLSFFQKREYPIEHFYQDPDHIHTVGVALIENVAFSVRFYSDEPTIRLYIDGLDLLPTEEVMRDEKGRVYLPPNEERVTLFQNHSTHLPWIPGFYLIKVVTQQNEFYTLLQINPKQLTVFQWEQMKQEIEDELKGLTKEFIQKTLHSHSSQAISFKLLNQFSLIQQKLPAALSSLRDLIQKGCRQIAKKHHLIPAHQIKILDEKSIRYRFKHPHQEHLLAPVFEVDYDIPENQWIKRIIIDLDKRLWQMVQAFEQYHFHLRKENQALYPYHYQSSTQMKIEKNEQLLQRITTYIQKAKRMKKMINGFMQTDWFQQISAISKKNIPSSLILDARYRNLFQIYRMLKTDNPRIPIDGNISINWKRTDLLYELWGFITICKTLNKLGFHADNEKFFTQKNEFALKPHLQSGTSLSFHKKALRAVLTYDEEIPLKSDLTHCPLYSIGKSKRPDVRLDLYCEQTYIGSLIFECKYRPLNLIWHLRRHYEIKRQLMDYAYFTKSTEIFHPSIPLTIRNQIRPVYQVWALYPTPKQTMKTSVNIINVDEHILLFPVSPGNENHHFVASLQSIIEKIESEYKNCF